MPVDSSTHVSTVANSFGGYSTLKRAQRQARKLADGEPVRCQPEQIAMDTIQAESSWDPQPPRSDRRPYTIALIAVGPHDAALTKAEENERNATNACQVAARSRLKAPSTATFDHLFIRSETSDPNKWSGLGHVTSVNSFNAPVTDPYFCEATPASDNF